MLFKIEGHEESRILLFTFAFPILCRFLVIVVYFLIQYLIYHAHFIQRNINSSIEKLNFLNIPMKISMSTLNTIVNSTVILFHPSMIRLIFFLQSLLCRNQLRQRLYSRGFCLFQSLIFPNQIILKISDFICKGRRSAMSLHFLLKIRHLTSSDILEINLLLR